MINAHHDAVDFAVPDALPGVRWLRLVDTARGGDETTAYMPGGSYPLQGRSLALLTHPRNDFAEPAP
jgi:glycogen operon protein